MKILLRVLALTVLVSGFSLKMFASHFMGVDISYQCNPNNNNPCEYRIVHSTYYDCGGNATQSYPLPGPPYPPAPSVTFKGNVQWCTGWLFPNWQEVSYIEVTPVCPNTSTKCYDSNATINGVSEMVYYTDIDLCNATCDYITLEWSECCRNYAITSGSSGNGIFSGSTIIDLTLSQCNNSPVFENPPVPYVCLNQSYTYNQGAYDPDGDSLSYAIIPCYKDDNSEVDYGSGYSSTAPLGPNCSIALDPITGDLTILATTIEIGVVCVEVTEWRNGVAIGTVVRDMQVTIYNCSNSLPTASGINATSSFIDSVCAGDEICFYIFGYDADSSSQTTSIYWDQSLSGATLSNLNNTVFDTISGSSPIARFCWHPTSANVGLNQFLITVQDDNCPVLGQNQYSFQILVTPGMPLTVIGDSYICAGDTATITASGGQNYFWSSGQQTATIHVSPTVATTYTVNDTTNTTGCEHLPTSFTVNISNPGLPTVIGEDSICTGGSTTLTAYAPGAVSYLWTPGNLTGNVVTVSPNQTTTYTVQSIGPNFCYGQDTTITIVVTPDPTIISITGDSLVCSGDTATLIASGAGSFVWSTGDNTPSISVFPTADSTFYVSGIVNGCETNQFPFDVDIVPFPNANAGNDRNVCTVNYLHLNAWNLSPNQSGYWTTIYGSGIYVDSLDDNTLVSGLSINNLYRWIVEDDLGLCPSDTDFIQVNVVPRPTLLNVLNTTTTTSTVEWTCTYDPDSFIVRWQVGCNGNFGYKVVPGNVRQTTISNLAPCLDYCWRVRGNCYGAPAPNHTTRYNFNVDTFTTLVGGNCLAVTGATLNHVQGCNYSVNWIDCTTADSFRVRYRKSTGNWQYTTFTTGNSIPVTLSPGTWYYRVQTYCNGVWSASNAPDTVVINSCRLANLNESDYMGHIQLFPNPTEQRSLLNFSSALEGEYSITLTDVSGRVLQSQSGYAVTGENTAEILVDGYTKGLYFVGLTLNGETRQLKLTVQ